MGKRCSEMLILKDEMLYCEKKGGGRGPFKGDEFQQHLTILGSIIYLKSIIGPRSEFHFTALVWKLTKKTLINISLIKQNQFFFLPSNGNHVMSILQVDLKIPGGTYKHDPLLRTTTFVGKVPSKPSSALNFKIKNTEKFSFCGTKTHHGKCVWVCV